MSDPYDQASDTEALERSVALAAQQAKAAASVKLEPTGECHNPLCCEPLDMPKLFCGPRCAAEHAKRCK